MSDSINGQITATISFDTIPYEILTPQNIIEVAANYSQIGLLPFPATIQAIGQMVPSGSALPNVSYPILGRGQAEVLFGVGAPLTEAINAILDNNTTQPLFAIGALPPGNAVAATNTVTFSTVAGGSGTVPFVLGGRSAATIINAGDPPATQAASFAAVVNADPRMPVTATVGGALPAGQVMLTAKYPGAAGNTMWVRLRGGVAQASDFVAGVMVVIADPANGTGVPDVAPMLAAISNDWRTDIHLGMVDDTTLTQVAADMERRYAANGRLDAHVYYGVWATTGQALGIASDCNSRFMSRVAYIGQSRPWQVGAALTGVAAFQTANDPARQLRTLPLVGILPVDPFHVPEEFETEELLAAGWSTLQPLHDGQVTLQRVVTCYRSNSQGIVDPAWRDLMRPKTMTRIRYDFASYLGLVWPRAKLADDGSVAAAFDSAVATPRRLANSWAARCQLYAQRGWIENLAATLGQSVFVRDSSDRNRVNSRLVVDQLGNLMVFAGRLEFLV